MVKTRHSEPNKPRLTSFVTLQTHKGRRVQTRKSPVNVSKKIAAQNNCTLVKQTD